MTLEEAVQIIKAMPTDQAIQIIKSKITGAPITTKIDVKIVLTIETENHGIIQHNE